MSSELNETKLCNMALGRIGAKRINDYDDTSETIPEAVHCRLHYAQTRDELLRNHWWRFARGRAELSQNAAYTADTTTFQWSYAYDLPNDFLRMRTIFEDNDNAFEISRYTYALEGEQLLSNESTVKIRYIKKVTDVPTFDPLFIEALVLKLAMKLVMPLAQDTKLYQLLTEEFYRVVLPKIRQIDKQETNTLAREDYGAWNDARMIGVGNPLKRYS